MKLMIEINDRDCLLGCLYMMNKKSLVTNNLFKTNDKELISGFRKSVGVNFNTREVKKVYDEILPRFTFNFEELNRVKKELLELWKKFDLQVVARFFDFSGDFVVYLIPGNDSEVNYGWYSRGKILLCPPKNFTSDSLFRVMIHEMIHQMEYPLRKELHLDDVFMEAVVLCFAPKGFLFTHTYTTEMSVFLEKNYKKKTFIEVLDQLQKMV